jgi:putative ABC transport system permease protein
VPLLSDLKYSARSLARTPGFAAALLLTIALGIGANASVLGFIRGSVTRDLPIADSDRVVSLFARDTSNAFGPLSFDAYLSLKARGDIFEYVGAARESEGSVVSEDRWAVMAVAAVTPEIATLLNLDTGEGVVLGDRTWRFDFGAPAVVRGKVIRVDSREQIVRGVAPDWLDGLYSGRNVDLWVPLHDESLQPSARASRTFWVLGRLQPGVPAGEAQAALNEGRAAEDALAVLRYTGVAPQAAEGLSRVSRMLPAAAGGVFLIACVNVAAFLLSRAFARSHETSVRVALGAGRRQLGLQLLSDSVVISVAGGALGVLLAYWTARIIPALFFVEDADYLGFAPDLGAIVGAAAACAAITVACGLMPLFEVRHDDPAAVLRRESGGPSKPMRRLRAGFVITQMACCCVLVIAAAVLFKGFRTALRTTTGNQLANALLVTLDAARGFDRSDLGTTYFLSAERTAHALPGVFETAWVSRLPGSRPAWSAFRVERPHLPVREVSLDVANFHPETLERIVLPPVAGRMFGGADTKDSCRVGIINEAAVELFDGDPLGRSIRDSAGEPVEIVGIVATRGPDEGPRRPTLYYYAEQTGASGEGIERDTFRVAVLPEHTAGVLDTNVVSPTYFDVLGSTVVAGDRFTTGSRLRCRVGVLNQEAAELYFGGDAVGGAIVDGSGRRTEIIGVIESRLLRTGQRPPEPAVYLPLAQDFVPRMTLIANTRGLTGDLVAIARRQLEAISGGRRPPVVTTLDAHLSRTALAPERISMLLVGAAAAIALTLGALGLYGAMADSAHHHRREIALRLALGAQRWRVIGHVLSEGLRLAGSGTAAGMLAAVLATRWLAGIAPSTGGVAAWVWLAAPLALLAAVAVASVLPARRAVNVDPLTIMRE